MASLPSMEIIMRISKDGNVMTQEQADAFIATLP
jgi:hypothetical protein